MQACKRGLGCKKSGKSADDAFRAAHILLTVDIEFDKNLSAVEVKEAVDYLGDGIRKQYPDIKYIYIEAGSVGYGGRPTADERQLTNKGGFYETKKCGRHY